MTSGAAQVFEPGSMTSPAGALDRALPGGEYGEHRSATGRQREAGTAPFAGAADLPSHLSYGAGIAICEVPLSFRYLRASSALRSVWRQFDELDPYFPFSLTRVREKGK